MEYTNLISLIMAAVAAGSMILNWFQYRSSKKGTELTNYEKQIELITKLQATKDASYTQALKNKDLEIEQLRKDMKELQDKLQHYSERLTVLQNAVNRLIGGGCKNMHCPNRIPYPVEELGDVLGIIEND